MTVQRRSATIRYGSQLVKTVRAAPSLRSSLSPSYEPEPPAVRTVASPLVDMVFGEFENSVERGGDRYVRPRRPAAPADRLVDIEQVAETLRRGRVDGRAPVTRGLPQRLRRPRRTPDCPGGGS
jgi:hypothetical protein